MADSTPLLTPEEADVLKSLVEAWNKFLALPELHIWEKREFMHAIHAGQQIVMSRPVLREQQNNG